MNIINIKNNNKYLEEYIEICSLEWGTFKTKARMEQYINDKKEEILNGDNVISVLGLINNNVLIGFISLFKYDLDERTDLTPWYATIYVKKEYRGKGYSKILNDAILKDAIRLGYNKIYLKTNLVDYYGKFGARYIEKINDNERLYYFELNK